jgi:cytidine deaminase
MKTPNAKDLLKQAAAAARSAYCPYSEYRVGAALVSADGVIFPGANIENASYGLTICAERAAFVAALGTGRREFVCLAVAASGIDSNPPLVPRPCGACLQVINEFCPPEFPIYAADAGNLDSFEQYKLGDLLPRPFGKQ